MNNTSITPLFQPYEVDFTRSTNNILFIKGVQGDGYGTRYVDISLMNNGKMYNISADSARVVIRGTKPDNNSIFNECEIISDNIVRVEITQQMAAIPGRGNYEISIISLSENRVLTSFPFFIMISKSAFDSESIISSNEFGLLVQKINQVDEMIEYIKTILGIDDTQESLDTTWSSSHIREVIEEKIDFILEGVTEEEIGALFE